MSSPETESPINPLPPVVMALFLVIIGVEIAYHLAHAALLVDRRPWGGGRLRFRITPLTVRS